MHATAKPDQANVTRRRFLQGIGAAGIAAGLPSHGFAFLGPAITDAAGRRGKRINLLEDGAFSNGAWGWQFTAGATLSPTGRNGNSAIHIRSTDGDYARFLVLGPQKDRTYTLSGWMRTHSIEGPESDCGAYVSASQFEFQGRPTEFTVDGKQATEPRYGNTTGSSDWKRFSQSVVCLETTAWFEVVLGIFRASGEAWFSGVTFVEGKEAAELEDTVDRWQAATWRHQDLLQSSKRARPSVAVLRQSGFPTRGAASDPAHLGKAFSATHDVTYLDAYQLAEAQSFSRERFDLLALPYGEVFPLPAKETILAFLQDGGDLFSTGGYAFRSPVVEHNGTWLLQEDVVRSMHGANLLPAFSPQGPWKSSSREFCSAATAKSEGSTTVVTIPSNLREQSADWRFDLPASGDAKQFHFSALIATENVTAAPDGFAYISVEERDQSGNLAYAARVTFAELRGTHAWHPVERLFYLTPTCRILRVRVGLKNATGTVRAKSMRLEARPDQVRINTQFGFPEDSLITDDLQIGIFDADFRLKRATQLAWNSTPHLATQSDFEGYAASGVVGMDHARWIPLLQAKDQLGRNRGAAGATMQHRAGAFARGSWTYFGIDNQDIFAASAPHSDVLLEAVSKAATQKLFLHTLESDLACYRDGEPVKLRFLVSNYGCTDSAISLNLSIRAKDTDQTLHAKTFSHSLAPGETAAFTEQWEPPAFEATNYRIVVERLEGNKVVDTLTSGIAIWKKDVLAQGMPITFRENYFQVEGRSVFLQGTDDYLHTFIDQDENPLTWLADARGCRDSCIDVYENLMGLRGPQHKPTEAWWRWIDAMLLNTQSVGGIFFPGMLVFSNTAVSDVDLADQKRYVRAFAERYRDATSIIYYLNGDLQLHDPNLPNLQLLYNNFLREKYGTDEALRTAWKLSPPEAKLGALTIRSGKSDWADVRTLDDFQFRTFLVRRWLNALHDSIREVDTKHPVTAEFYQSPVSGIDLLTALGKLELANFGYFADKDEDYYRFPQVCKFLDQSARGKGINVGEFGVKTHPAWNDTGYYIEARTEQYEQAYFLGLTHYAFALGASKVQNWCWKYPDDLTFEWGINYPNDLVPRDVRAYYRNSGLLFRSLRPRYEDCETVVLLASENRMGGQGHRIVEGQLNAIRLLLDARIRFSTLTDEFLSELSPRVKTIFYPLPYCPSDAIVAQLTKFVEAGGQLYLSGDISYDGLRQRTRLIRLEQLCGVDFLSERYPNIDYTRHTIRTHGTGAWPTYDAAPGIMVRPHAETKTHLATVDGTPVVIEHTLGQGRVVFSTDPIELHADPRFHSYGHTFYRALLHTFNLHGPALTPATAPIHCFRIPSQDKREISVLVHHEASSPSHAITLQTAAGVVALTLQPRLPGVIVATSSGVHAIEASGHITEDGKPLLTTEPHTIAIAFGTQILSEAARILLLPMGQGIITLHAHRTWRNPIALVGEIVNGRWKRHAARSLQQHSGTLTLHIDSALSLAMILLCEHDDIEATTQHIELWVDKPWKLSETD
jgi:hypothetical protein